MIKIFFSILLIIFSNYVSAQTAPLTCPNNSSPLPSTKESLTRYVNEPQWMCGRIFIPDNSSAIEGTVSPQNQSMLETRRDLLFNALYEAQATIGPSAEELLLKPAANSEWEFMSNFLFAGQILIRHVNNLNFTMNSIANSVYNNLANAQLPSDYNAAVQGYASQAENSVKRAISDGWIHAGSYYFTMIKGISKQDTTVRLPVDKPINTAGIQTLLRGCYTSSMLKANQYLTETNNMLRQTGSDSLGDVTFDSAGMRGGPTKSALNAIFKGLPQKIVNAVNEKLTWGSNLGDPLHSMASLGSNIAIITEIVFWSSIGAAFLLWMGSSMLHCIQPAGPTFQALLTVILPFAIILILLTYVAAITLALYVPMIPYLVFLFASIGWIILVIESIVAAPLIALGLIIPSEDEIGKAGHALVILLGLFLRPALMIVGFVMAAKLLKIGIDMLNFGFAAAYESSAVITVFSILAVLFMYVGIATAFVHEAFSLIYVLPDKVLRWMGGQEETSSVKGQVQGLEGTVREGAKHGQAFMKQGLGKASKQAKGGKGGKGGGKGGAIGA
jgi:conjugal transfer/type IV secretion protein DotA/TraY